MADVSKAEKIAAAKKKVGSIQCLSIYVISSQTN